MNKKLLTLAVAAAVAAPMVAQADVKVYGRLQAEYNVEDRDCNGCDSQQGIDDHAGQSRFGIKATEKLGGGLTAFTKAEFRLDPSHHNTSGTNGNSSGATGTVGARDMSVGIKGSWGSIAAGSFHSPYKTAGGVKWDPWTATHLQARRGGGMSGGAGIGGHNGFMRNALYYSSPNINGFSVQFAISPDETNSGANNGTSSDNDYSLAVQYKNGPWHAIFAHNRNNSSNASAASGDDETLTKLGLRWKQGNHTVAGQYEWINDADVANTGTQVGNQAGAASQYSRIKDWNNGGQADGDIFWLNYQFKSGNNIFTASYGQTDSDGTGANSDENDTTYWAAGIIHKFSKKTRIFGGYTATNTDASSTRDADRDAWTIGLRKDF
jgi:predicted porin